MRCILLDNGIELIVSYETRKDNRRPTLTRQKLLKSNNKKKLIIKYKLCIYIFFSVLGRTSILFWNKKSVLISKVCSDFAATIEQWTRKYTGNRSIWFRVGSRYENIEYPCSWIGCYFWNQNYFFVLKKIMDVRSKSGTKINIFWLCLIFK